MSSKPLPLYHQPIARLTTKLRQGETTSVELTKAFLDRIKQKDPTCKAYISIDREKALYSAEKADRTLEQNKGTMLTGIPIAIKDNICTTNLPTTCASKLLKSYTSPFDATVVKKLKNAGAVILGKTNLDEFAMGGSTENSAFFTTRNPWDTDHVAGGSSGGSAAALAYGGCAGALGGDTGGSIRQPAAFCGVVGMKPTYGRVSRWGNVAMASSLDQIGPMAKTIADCAILLEAIAGWDKKDATSCNTPVPHYLKNIDRLDNDFSIGICPELFENDGVDQAVISCFHQTVETYEKLGARIVNVKLPHLKYALPVYYTICPAEISANMARYDGIRYGEKQQGEDFRGTIRKTRGAGLGPEVKRRILIGGFVLSAGYYDAYYKKASQVRALIRQDFLTGLEKCDAICMPATPFPAFKIGELISDPLRLYMADVFTVGANLAGLPALCFPAGFAGPLPIGIQLIGKPFEEATLLQIGHAFEKNTTWFLADRLGDLS